MRSGAGFSERWGMKAPKYFELLDEKNCPKIPIYDTDVERDLSAQPSSLRSFTGGRSSFDGGWKPLHGHEVAKEM